MGQGASTYLRNYAVLRVCIKTIKQTRKPSFSANSLLAREVRHQLLMLRAHAKTNLLWAEAAVKRNTDIHDQDQPAGGSATHSCCCVSRLGLGCAWCSDRRTISTAVYDAAAVYVYGVHMFAAKTYLTIESGSRSPTRTRAKFL